MQRRKSNPIHSIPCILCDCHLRRFRRTDRLSTPQERASGRNCRYFAGLSCSTTSDKNPWRSKWDHHIGAPKVDRQSSSLLYISTGAAKCKVDTHLASFGRSQVPCSLPQGEVRTKCHIKLQAVSRLYKWACKISAIENLLNPYPREAPCKSWHLSGQCSTCCKASDRMVLEVGLP